MSEYEHGIYAEIITGEAVDTAASIGTLPVYFGILPIHQKMDYSKLVNVPIVLRSFATSVNSVGYSEDWSYSICEAVYAHFKNSTQPIGPIVAINSFDPDVHRKATKTSTSITFVNKKAKIANPNIILKTVSITGEILGKDFTAVFNEAGTELLLTDIGTTPIGTATVEFFEADLTAVSEQDIITGIGKTGNVYVATGMIPNLFAAPGWSDIKAVSLAMKTAANKINGHWYAFCNVDLTATKLTIQDAIAVKLSNENISHIEAPCWPLAKMGDRVYHLSTLTTIAMQLTDSKNDGIPFETPSNTKINISGLVVDNGGIYTDIEYDQETANQLNQNGIRTATFWGGSWKLWGPHTGEYVYGSEIPPEHIFDSSVRMFQYIANRFQSRYGNEIDRMMMRSGIDTIKNDFQEWLDGLVAKGALLSAKIDFLTEGNPTSDMIKGDFVFDIKGTAAPAAKSLTARIRYSPVGLKILWGDEENA